MDQCGLHTFKQIKRTANAAIYQRIRKDGSTHSFETFKVKVVKAGAKLPNGNVVAEDYESYPGKSSFGRYAYSCCNLEQAEIRYEQLLKNQEVLDNAPIDDEDDDVVSVKKNNTEKTDGKGKRGRKAKDRKNLKIPKDKFTMKQLELLNPDFSFAFLYQHVRGLLNIEFKIVESLGGKRGKPTIVYAPIDLPVVNTEFKDVVEQKLNS